MPAGSGSQGTVIFTVNNSRHGGSALRVLDIWPEVGAWILTAVVAFRQRRAQRLVALLCDVHEIIQNPPLRHLRPESLWDKPHESTVS